MKKTTSATKSSGNKRTSSSRSKANSTSQSKANTGSQVKANAAVSKPASSSAKLNSQDQNKQDQNKNESLLEKFFMDQLKDIYYAENKIIKSLPILEDASTTEELQEAFSDHRHQTQKHIQRLEKVFTLLNQKPEAKKCEAIEGILKECESIISETEDGSMTRDAALIMAAQKVEHYEIATYGGLVQFAITMGKKDIAELLDKTLVEEEETDHLLTKIAEWHINIEAEEEDKYSWNRQKAENES